MGKGFFPRVQPTGWGVGNEVLSSQINTLDIDHAAAAGEVEVMVPNNWGPGIDAAALVSGGNWAPLSGVYETTSGRWYQYLSTPGGNTGLAFTADGGRTWAPMLGSLELGVQTTYLATAVAPGNAQIFGINSFGSIGLTLEVVPTGTMTQAASTITTATGAAAFWYPAASAFVAVLGGQSGATFTGQAFTCLTNGTTTTVTSSLPASWQSGSNHVGAYYSAVGTVNGDAIVALGGVTPATDTARLVHVTFPSSVLTFTDVTPSVSTGKIILGVGFDVANSLWGLVTYDGTSTVVYSSPDLATWTACKTITGRGVGFTIVNGVWIVGAPPAGLTNPRLYASWDVASLGASSTWHQTASPDVAITSLANNGRQLFAGAGATSSYLSTLAGFV